MLQEGIEVPQGKLWPCEGTAKQPWDSEIELTEGCTDYMLTDRLDALMKALHTFLRMLDCIFRVMSGELGTMIKRY